jgi:hypothetical protein
MGGAATGRGVEYQTQYAVSRALLLIQDALCSPDTSVSIGIEPRVSSSVEVTAWDILVCNADTEEELVEAKASPTHADVIEWLDRVTAGEQEPTTTILPVRIRQGHAALAFARPPHTDVARVRR